jgi:hypothetical protein
MIFFNTSLVECITKSVVDKIDVLCGQGGQC